MSEAPSLGIDSLQQLFDLALARNPDGIAVVCDEVEHSWKEDGHTYQKDSHWIKEHAHQEIHDDNYQHKNACAEPEGDEPLA